MTFPFSSKLIHYDKIHVDKMGVNIASAIHIIKF